MERNHENLSADEIIELVSTHGQEAAQLFTSLTSYDIMGAFAARRMKTHLEFYEDLCNRKQYE